MGKTSEKENVTQIDPQQRGDARELSNLARLFAGGPASQQYEGIQIADFTPQQRLSMDASNQAASAFGAPTAEYGGPTGAIEQGGISGFSPYEVAQENSGAPANFMEEFYKMAGKETPYHAPQRAGGGGKK